MKWSNLAGAGTALLMGIAALTGVPSSAVATSDPVVEESGDTVTYTDPALARARTTTVEGTLQIAYVDRVDRAGRPTSELQYSVTTDDGESVPIEVDEDLPVSAANGDIEAEVVDAGSDDAQLAGATVDTTPASGAPSGGAHRAYVVLVAKTGSLPSEAEAAARLSDKVLQEWVDESEGAISAFTVEGTATLAAGAPASQSKAALCRMTSPYGLWSEGANAFPDVDFDTVGTPNHLIMIVSGSGCSAVSGAGLGIGKVGNDIDDGGQSTLLWDDRYLDGTGAHELGHNFSLSHANAVACASCAVDAYYDIFSVMGFGTKDNEPPALDTAYRDLLGITQPGEVDTVTKQSAIESTITKTLQPRGSASGLRALKVVDPVGGQEYWVENRAGGDGDRDAGATYDPGSRLAVTQRVHGRNVDTHAYQFRPGVTVTQAGPDHTLELVPRENGFTDDASVLAGKAWTSPSTGVEVKVDSTASGGPAQVTVTTRIAAPQILTSGYGRKAMVGRAAFTRRSGWPASTTFSYAWIANGQTVSRVATYNPHPMRRGQTLRLKLTGTPPGGRPTTMTSMPIPIDYGRFSASRPRVSGTLKVGRTVRVSRGTWSPSATKYYYRWYRSTKVISGATRSSYKLTKWDKGHRIRVRVVGRRTGYAQLITFSSYRGPTK